MKTSLFRILASAFSLVLLAAAHAAPGALDPTFGGTGRVTTDFDLVIEDESDDDDIGRCVAIQGDGRIVVAGSSHGIFDADFALARYLPNGSLDTTFGGTGRVTTAISTAPDFAHDFGNAMAIQSDGRIVVAGMTYNGANYDFAVVRYLADGSLDTSFGGTGKVTTGFGGTHDAAHGVAIQSDGKIVVAGYATTGGSLDIAVVRFLPDGRLDASFGGTGKVTTDLGGNDSARSVAVRADGRIVVAGATFNLAGSRIAVVRYEAGGGLDASFGGTGKVVADVFSGNIESAASVALLRDGKILVAGGVAAGNIGNDFALVRFREDGSLDPSFGAAGSVSTGFGPGSEDYLGSMVVQPDGKIVAAGISRTGLSSFFALARFEADGALDATFGTAGKVTTPMGSPDDEELGVALQKDGKIVVAGVTASAENDDFVVLRYEGGPLTVRSLPLFTKGDALPPLPAIPSGARWSAFGVPAINEAGDVAFLANWTTGRRSGQAIFATHPATGELQVILQRGLASPPHPSGGLPRNATVQAFKDPILAPNGDVLTPVTLAGAGISSANNAALVWSPRGELGFTQIVAREGSPVAVGTTIRAFEGIAIQNRRVVFTAILNGGTVTRANNSIVCKWDEHEGLQTLLREGQRLGDDERTLTGFKTLIAGAGSPGQGRGMHRTGELLRHGIGVLAEFNDGSSAVLDVDEIGTVKKYSATDDGTGTFQSYGVPAWGDGFAAPAFLATRTSGVKGVFQYADATGAVEPLLQVGDAIFVGTHVEAVSDPVLSTDARKRAGGVALDDGSRAIWEKADDSAVGIVARSGTQAGEVPTGALWGSFESLAISTRGPLLLAKLTRGAGGVDGGNDAGVWAVDSAGALRLLFRERDPIAGRVLASFTVLKAVAGSPGTTRAFNDAGQVIWRAAFSDGTSAIMVTTVP